MKTSNKSIVKKARAITRAKLSKITSKQPEQQSGRTVSENKVDFEENEIISFKQFTALSIDSAADKTMSTVQQAAMKLSALS